LGVALQRERGIGRHSCRRRRSGQWCTGGAKNRVARTSPAKSPSSRAHPATSARESHAATAAEDGQLIESAPAVRHVGQTRAGSPPCTSRSAFPLAHTTRTHSAKQNIVSL